MPELPDVETFRRYVDATSLHQRIESVDIDAPRMLRGISGAKFRAGLEGKSFESTLRHGKYLFIMLSSELWLLLHFGLTGQLKYFKDKAKAPSHMRMLLRFKNGCHFACLSQRRLGQIRLLDEPRHFIGQQHLGPDALAPGIQLPRFKEMFRARRGSVKSALMDQHFLAGIGNIYSDEILFRARLHPRSKANGLDGRGLTALHRAVRHVLRVAIERQADPARMPQSWMLPHRDGDGECPRCGNEFATTTVAGRTAYFCPRCQIYTP